MFEGNMFFPDTGTPIWKIARNSTRFAVWLPDPLTVATWMLKSLTIRDVKAALPVLISLDITLLTKHGKQLTQEKL
jgi:hypothetical protein